ncbi:MAG: radical SAM family RiPP maturation amino acid epimerase [Bacteroidales bacterium]|nr:radical SAM family RiPP maturation amino acid epimerase [Bacteroidales bacterium]MBK7174475.1 radical SAM family RiPP maturation amino acid epimerase [Bacteroidales bacterium]
MIETNELTEILPIFSGKGSLEYNRRIGETKRVLERWTCDNDFREKTAADFSYPSAYFNFDLDPDEVGILTDPEYAKAFRQSGSEIPSIVKQYRSFVNEKISHRDRLQTIGCAPENERLRKWRQRQINRCYIELGKAKSAAIIHSPINFELTKGCSVGCWFCAVASEKLSKVFRYTDDNAKLWNETLQSVKNVLGNSGSFGTCYYATEPLDNPDYEKFITDFGRILGHFPQTTTALAYKYPDRIRTILKLSEENNGFVERFSVLSLPILEKIHNEFSPEELIRVEMLPQTNESNSVFAKAGRAAQHMDSSKVSEEGSTIACITGFLINMAEKSIRMVTPCNSSKRWPLGYWTLANEPFTDAQDLEETMNRLIEKFAKPFPEADDLMRFHQDFTYAPATNAIEVSSVYMRIRIKDLPLISEVGELISQGKFTAGEIAAKLSSSTGEPQENIFYTINRMFDYGILDEEPDTSIQHKRLD